MIDSSSQKEYKSRLSACFFASDVVHYVDRSHVEYQRFANLWQPSGHLHRYDRTKLVLCAHIFVSDIHAWTPQQLHLIRHKLGSITSPLRRLCGHCNMTDDQYTICCLRCVHVVPERHAGMGSVIPASLQEYVHGDAYGRRGLCQGLWESLHCKICIVQPLSCLLQKRLHHVVMAMVFGHYQAFAQSCGVLQINCPHNSCDTTLLSSVGRNNSSCQRGYACDFGSCLVSNPVTRCATE